MAPAAVRCPRCPRANPNEAQFCYYDGAELRAAGGGAARGGDLGREFIFPSGRRCRTYDELVRGCTEEWPAARDMLRQGGLRAFLAGIGRMDLALVAQQAATQPDLDVALDSFLAQLPARDASGPRLDLAPRRINLGKLNVGESRQFALTITNQGGRLLHGSVKAEGGEWIRIGTSANGSAEIKTGKQQSIPLQIDTFGLIAGQPYTGKLTVITNGGAVEVPIRMDVVAVPFADGPLTFHGVTSPRDLALQMKNQPKLAGPLLETGSVMRWFAANGWRYPVQGATAKGIAGVQQFFEGMGLSSPPKVEVSSPEVLMVCRPGQPVHGHVTLRTPVKKWVYGGVESDVPWLTVLTPDVGGAQQVQIEFEATARGLEKGRRHTGHLTITANGGQRLTVTVHADVPARKSPKGGQLVRLVLLGALCGLVFRTFISLPDPFARELGSFGAWVNGSLENRLGVKTDPNAVISEVLANSPAERAALKNGDRIVKVDDLDIGTSSEVTARVALRRAIDRAGVGNDPAELRVEREGAPVAVKVTLDRDSPPDYVGRFTLVTAWLGIPIGLVLLWRRSGARDVLGGIVVGAVTGVVIAATVASLVKVLDGLSRWVAPFQYPGLAIAAWTAFGAGLFLVLAMLGRPGRSLAATIAAPLSWTAHALGFRAWAEQIAEE